MAVGKKSIMRAASAGSNEKKDMEVQFMTETSKAAEAAPEKPAAKTTTRTAAKKVPAKKAPAKKAPAKATAAKPAAAQKPVAAKKTTPKKNYFGVNDPLPTYLL